MTRCRTAFEDFWAPFMSPAIGQDILCIPFKRLFHVAGIVESIVYWACEVLAGSIFGSAFYILSLSALCPAFAGVTSYGGIGAFLGVSSS